MTEYIASSELVGRRPRIWRISAYSSGLRPRSAHGCSWSGSPAATATVSSTAAIYRPPTSVLQGGEVDGHQVDVGGQAGARQPPAGQLRSGHHHGGHGVRDVGADLGLVRR